MKVRSRVPCDNWKSAKPSLSRQPCDARGVRGGGLRDLRPSLRIGKSATRPRGRAVPHQEMVRTEGPLCPPASRAPNKNAPPDVPEFVQCASRNGCGRCAAHISAVPARMSQATWTTARFVRRSERNSHILYMRKLQENHDIQTACLGSVKWPNARPFQATLKFPEHASK